MIALYLFDAIYSRSDGGQIKHCAKIRPAELKLCHEADEYIDIADLEKAAEYYKSVISSFLT